MFILTVAEIANAILNNPKNSYDNVLMFDALWEFDLIEDLENDWEMDYPDSLDGPALHSGDRDPKTIPSRIRYFYWERKHKVYRRNYGKHPAQKPRTFRDYN